MNRLARCASDRTDGITLRCFLWSAVIACCEAFLDDLNLSIEACGTALYQRDIRSQTHLVDMSPSIQVIKSVEYHGKASKPVHIELGVLDVGMMSLELHARVELMCCFLSHLSPIS